MEVESVEIPPPSSQPIAFTVIKPKNPTQKAIRSHLVLFPNTTRGFGRVGGRRQEFIYDLKFPRKTAAEIRKLDDLEAPLTEKEEKEQLKRALPKEITENFHSNPPIGKPLATAKHTAVVESVSKETQQEEECQNKKKKTKLY